MVVFYSFLISFSIVYLYFIVWAIYLWWRRGGIELRKVEAYPTISLIVPFRNEEKNLPDLLTSLDQLNYPKEKYEIILVNDHSTDAGVEWLKANSSFRLFHNKDGETGKKMALEKGIREAHNELIVTSDADSVLPENWLLTIAYAHTEMKYDFTTGPIHLTGSSVFADMQALENIAMMVITHAGYASTNFHLANGANLSFKKEAFEKVQGYTGNKHRASGDDVLLAQKLSQDFSLGFNKSRDAIVKTPAVMGISAFIGQRIRWAAKVDLYSERMLLFLPIFVSCFYGLILISFLLLPSGSIWVLFWGLGIKLACDIFMVLSARSFFGFPWKKLWIIIPASFFHLLYVPIVGLYSTIHKDYKWKGRKVE